MNPRKLTLPSLLLFAAALPASAQVPPAPPAVEQAAADIVEPVTESTSDPAVTVTGTSAAVSSNDEGGGASSSASSSTSTAAPTSSSDSDSESASTSVSASSEDGVSAVEGRIVLRSSDAEDDVKVIKLGKGFGSAGTINVDSFASVPQQGPVTFMGVSVTPAAPELAVHLPLDRGTGLVIQSVNKDSPAEKAGLKESDILTKFDDQILIHPVQFSVLVTGKKEGDSVKLTVLRKGEKLEVPVTLGRSDQADFAGGPAQLRIGDVAIQVGGEGNPALRTMIKRMHTTKDGQSQEQILVDGKEISLDEVARDRLAALKYSRNHPLSPFRKAESAAAKAHSDIAVKLSEAAAAQAQEASAASQEEVIRALRQALESLEAAKKSEAK